MSIIERYSPLNLAYKVIIVTNASKSEGVTVCNTLLKSNALVLGTDKDQKDPSLSASAFTHFQFYQCDLADSSSADDIVAYAKKIFKVEHIDGLVNLADAGDSAETKAGYAKLAHSCQIAMEGAVDGGSVVNTLIQAASNESSSTGANIDLAGPMGDLKVRCNAVVPSTQGDGEAHSEYKNAKSHFNFLLRPHADHSMQATGNPSSAKQQAVFEFSNVVLFLISALSRDLNHKVLSGSGKLVPV